jgi:hypothetical protein
MSFYPILNVDPVQSDQIEQMGSKRKFWFYGSQPPTTKFLFKYNRPQTGEDWSEKVASHIAELLGLPHAEVELASCAGDRGIISKDFTKGEINGELVHGNELMAILDTTYPKHSSYKVPQYTIQRIAETFSRIAISVPKKLAGEIGSPMDLFLGYLFLDAIIGNTDRHHENWGILLLASETEDWYVELAPTFDHASSLGRELTDERREFFLAYPNELQKYIERARSAIYLNHTDSKPLRTIDCFTEFSKACSSTKLWLDKLAKISDDSICSIVDRLPPGAICDKSKEFVIKVLLANKGRLLSIETK